MVDSRHEHQLEHSARRQHRNEIRNTKFMFIWSIYPMEPPGMLYDLIGSEKSKMHGGFQNRMNLNLSLKIEYNIIPTVVIICSQGSIIGNAA